MVDNILARKIGRRLRQARLGTSPRLTQEEVGERLGLGRAGYSNIENGRTLLTTEHLIKLPGIFGKPIPWYLGFDDVNNQINDIVKIYAEANDVKTNDTFFAQMREMVEKFTQVSTDSRERLLQALREMYDEELDRAIETLTPEERKRLMRRSNNGD